MNCPHCGTQIGDAFGIVECPQCKSMLVLDLNGNLQLSDSSSEKNVQADIISQEPLQESQSIFNESHKETTSDFGLNKDSDLAQQTESVVDNSRDSQFSELIYDLYIDEILTQEVFDQIEFVLSESRLKLDVNFNEKKSSKIIIKRINAVKASYIVSKIKHLPIKISWSQNNQILEEAL